MDDNFIWLTWPQDQFPLLFSAQWGFMWGQQWQGCNVFTVIKKMTNTMNLHGQDLILTLSLSFLFFCHINSDALGN